MIAVVVVDGRLEVVERPNPQPGPYDVVVEVAGAGVNAADLLQRRGLYPAPPGWPVDVPGLELAGIVVAVGEAVNEDHLGRRVCAIVGGGGQASHCVVPVEHLIDVPDGIDLVAAGGFAEAFLTAHDALVSQASLDSADRVLISGAAGGVGSAALQIAARRGAHVIAVTRTTQFHDELRRLGAAQTVTLDEVPSLEPVDLVLELVGAPHLELAQRVLAPRARVVVIGVGGGARVDLDLRTIMSRRARITGSTLRARTRDEKAAVSARAREDLEADWSRGTLRVILARTFELTEVSAAYEYFSRPGKFGKVVLRPNA